MAFRRMNFTKRQMLKIKPPNYKFCPFCGKKLGIRIEEGQKEK